MWIPLQNDTCRIHKEVKTHHLPFMFTLIEDVYICCVAFRYGFLLPENNMCQDPLSTSVAILQQFGIPPSMYRVAYAKLYFRAGQVCFYIQSTFLYPLLISLEAQVTGLPVFLIRKIVWMRCVPFIGHMLALENRVMFVSVVLQEKCKKLLKKFYIATFAC